MAVNIGPKIGIDGEKEYRKQVNDLITQQKTYNAEMRELESSFDDSTSAMEKARKKGKLLNKQIENQEKQVEELEKGLKASAEKYGDNATETMKWRQAVANAKTELNKMRTELDKTPKSLDKVGKKMQAVGKKMQSVGDGMTKYVTTPIVGLAAGAIAAFNEVDAGMDVVVTKTGATGEALEDLQQSAKDIATTIPTSFEEAGAAVGEVNTKFGLVGDDLEALSGQFIKFAQLNEMDVSSAVDATQKAMQAFGLETEDAGLLLDAMNATGQKTGISMEDLSASMVKNAASLSAMGLSAYDAANFLGQVEMSGANTETVMAGMQKAMTNAAKDGKTLPEALAEFQGIVDSTASDQEKLNAAVDLFGQKAGPAILEACEQGSLSFEGLASDLEEYSGNIDQTFENTLDGPDKMQVALNQVKEAGAQMGEDLLNIAAPLVADFAGFISELADKFNDLDEDERKFVEYTVGAFAIGGPLLSGAGRAVSAIGNVATKASGAIATVKGVGEAAGGLSGAALPIVAAVGTAAWAGYAIYSMTQDIEAKSEDAIAIIDAQKENITTLQESVKAVDEALDSGNRTIQEINDQSAVAMSMVDDLEELEKQSNKTTAEEAKMQALVADLNRMYPGLNANIDESTGSLSKSTEEIRNYVEEAKNMALVEAYTKASTGALDAYVQATHDLYVAQQGQQAILDKIAEKRAEIDKMVAVNDEHPYTYSANEIQDLNDDIDDLTNSLGDANAAIAEAEKAVEAQAADLEAWDVQTQAVTGSVEELTDETEVAGQQINSNLKAGFDGLSEYGIRAAKETAQKTKEIIDGTKYEPKITSIGVLASAYESARNAMQNYFNNNPIIAKLKATATKHSEGGFTYRQQLSWLSEGNLPEVVIPLDESKREKAISLFMQAGEVLGVSDMPTQSSVVSIPGTSGALSSGSGSGFGINVDELYAAVAQGAAAGMESANIRIYWNNREAGRIMRDMGVQFA